jgi:hypothetical protein
MLELTKPWPSPSLRKGNSFTTAFAIAILTSALGLGKNIANIGILT